MPQPYYTTNGAWVFTGVVSALSYASANDNYYVLPYSDTQKIIVQFGARAAQAGGTLTYVTFFKAYAELPSIFITQFDTYTHASAGRVYDYSTTGFRVDNNPGGSGKPAFSWMSIGICSNF
jgi:hypothetical protein